MKWRLVLPGESHWNWKLWNYAISFSKLQQQCGVMFQWQSDESIVVVKVFADEGYGDVSQG